MKRAIVTLKGRVVGVGFRDRVLEVAERFAVAGSVGNVRDLEALEIDVEGDAAEVDRFVSAVLADPPSGARIDAVEEAEAPLRELQTFTRAPTR
ncbi:MAG: acylphosphatase [Candidatus Eremiobacteraeota bacterium]|nr:acylphosphatase [Candidatus Eremiobacteraeota bacterium]MBC5802255.1 acylphosphatase [Candidatus Eremiobacteraeota bacterium]MBC5822768.1 acylphosphatase [Candidatus Eremiobacteraeota bacterium]